MPEHQHTGGKTCRHQKQRAAAARPVDDPRKRHNLKKQQHQETDTQKSHSPSSLYLSKQQTARTGLQ
ncbi:hypothetical protein, partial [Neisseria meningitidis]|uniref:hypothetical protein n=1 Tax=Neisseria meningitidis TaxID=487 RepID=UPI003530EF9B